MSITQLIPLTGQNERFSTALAQTPYQLQVVWRDDPCGQGGWILDINDSNGLPIINGMAMVSGADLLAQYEYLGIGGQLYIQNGLDPDAVATFTDLGTDTKLYFVQD